MNRLSSILIIFLIQLSIFKALAISPQKIHVIDCQKFSLDEKILAYSIQGILNRIEPTVFLICNDSWQSKTADNEWLSYLHHVKRMEFDTIPSLKELVDFALIRSEVKGFTLYNPSNINGQETIIALNRASVSDYLPVTENLFKGIFRPNNKLIIEDIRGKWKTGSEAINYYVTEIMPLSSRKSAFSYGREQKSRGQGGLDYAIAKKLLIYKIDIRDQEEHPYFVKVMNFVKSPAAILGGWHSEGQDVNFGYSSGGNYALLTDAACANLSLLAAIPVKKKISFKQPKHDLILDTTKYYVLLQVNEGDTYKWISTFMSGLWKNQKRGSFPIAWGIPPQVIDDIPVMLEYYQQTATGNDSFFAAPSGAGYLWPNHTPVEKFKAFASHTQHYMSLLGLQSVDVWGFSWKQNLEFNKLAPSAKLISGEIYASDLDEGTNLWLDNGQLVAVAPKELWYKGSAKELRTFAESKKTPYFIPVYAGHYKFMDDCQKNLDDRFVFVGVEDFIDLMEQARKLNPITSADKKFVGTGIVSLSSGKYFCGFHDKTCYTGLIACRTVIGRWELFDVIKMKDKTVAFQLKTNGKYVRITNDKDGQILKADGDTITPESKFKLINNSDGTTSIQAVANGKYLTDLNFAIPMRLEKKNNSINQKFRIENSK